MEKILEKSGKSQGILSVQKSVNPDSTLKKKIVITVGSIIFRLINLHTRGV